MFNLFKKKEKNLEQPRPPVIEQKPVEYASDKTSGNVFSVDKVFNITGVGMVIVGKVVSGSISKTMTAMVNGKQISIKTIEAHHQQKEQVIAGEMVGINVQGEGISQIVKGIIIEFK